MVSGRLFYSVAVFASFISLQSFADCDPVVKQLRTAVKVSLCDLQARYNAAAEKLDGLGINDVNHIGNVYAPRFIRRQDWLNYLKNREDSEFSAWKTYEPSPLTWYNWSSAERYALDPEDRKDSH